MGKISLYFLWLLLLLSACSTTKNPFYSKENINWQANSIPDSDQIEYSIFLIGDAGAPSLSPPETVLSLLQQKLLLADTNSAVVFLGDNIYNVGLPEKQHPERIEAEQKLNAQLDILKNYDGKIVFLPGNHDWQRGKKGGLAAVIRQEGYIEQYLNKGNTLLPDDGCPGPVEVHLSDEIVLIILNTQWWLHKWDKPTSDCDIKDKADFLLQLENVLKNNKGKKIIVAGHHPLFSMGNHAGHFSVKDHIFPLTNLKNYLYVPLPLIGSLYPAYRKFFGNIQDLAHPQYKFFRKGLVASFNNSEDIIYAAGHEHNLQYIKHNQQHHIVSGAGSKTTYTAKRQQADFAYAHKGFIELNYFKNGETWMKVWVIDKEDPVFVKQLFSHSG